MKTIKGKILGVLLATLVIFGLTTEQSNANAIINFDKVKKINFPCSKCFSTEITLYHGDYNYHMYKCKNGHIQTSYDRRDFTPKYNSTKHWVECSCGWKSKKYNHDLKVEKKWYTGDDQHIEICSDKNCEYKVNEYCKFKNDETNHWIECECGNKGEKRPHQKKLTGSDKNILKSGEKCLLCGYKHKCAGTIGGSFAGWFADEKGHYVKCTCGKEMKGNKNSKWSSNKSNIAGKVAHNFVNGKCTSCGYREPHKCVGTLGGSYAGWFANDRGHYVKCVCGEFMKGNKNSKWSKTQSNMFGTVPHNFVNGKCTSCGYKKPKVLVKIK